jgi:hypothetical protein
VRFFGVSPDNRPDGQAVREERRRIDVKCGVFLPSFCGGGPLLAGNSAAYAEKIK